MADQGNRIGHEHHDARSTESRRPDRGDPARRHRAGTDRPAGRGRRWPSETGEPGAAAYARGVRAQTKLTQAEFASRIGVPIETVRNWEQGKRSPRGPARALLKLIEKAPAGGVRRARPGEDHDALSGPLLRFTAAVAFAISPHGLLCR